MMVAARTAGMMVGVASGSGRVSCAQAPLKWASRWGCAALQRGAGSVPAVEGVELCSGGGLVWGADDEAEDQAHLAVGWEGDDEAELGVAGVGSADVDGAGLSLFEAGACDLLEGLTGGAAGLLGGVVGADVGGPLEEAGGQAGAVDEAGEGLCGVDAAGA